jgi:eukaryotic-like serine/threonine-protein kinase
MMGNDKNPHTQVHGDSSIRLRELFDRLIELPPGERAHWLTANVPDTIERATLDRWLAADDGSGFLDTPAAEHASRLRAEEVHTDGLIGQQIGSFRILRALGQGGMAAVFLGERTGADFQQQVAIKLLRRGLYSELEQRLFARERQVLAALEHPNIARLIDGGITQAGIPYLVMEFVDGAQITSHANERGLDLRQRLGLFLDVCRAVEAAHRNLVVHRDIKPSNILVTVQGEVKLLDFGIAKLIEEEGDITGTVGVFTPDYAAPEQLRGGTITTATDVYGLGVLMHELLLGMRPSGTPTRRPSSRVNEIETDLQSPVREMAPARLRKLLRGDLDNILLKSLAEEPERRYTSAGAFADDIERHLHRRPVTAHPPSRIYRTKKFIQRHRGGVALTVIFMLGILSALALALWQADVARRQAIRANTVRDFIVGLFDAARAHLPRDQRPTPEALVEVAQRQLVAANNLDTATRTDLLRTLGEVELSLSNFARAENLFDQAASTAAQTGDAKAVRSARVLHADVLQRSGKNNEAIAELNPQLDSLRATPSQPLLRALSVVAAAEMMTGKPADAIAHRREAADAADRLYGVDSTEALAVQLDVGNTLARAEQFPLAVSVLTPLLAKWKANNAPADDRYVAALSSLATATDGIGDKPATEAHYRELLTLKEKIYTAPHDAIASTMRDLAQIVARSERFVEAESLLTDALAMQKKVYGKDHQEIASTYNSLGEIFVQQRRFADGDANYREAIAVCERAAIKEEICPYAHNNLGMSLYRQDKLAEAKAEMTAALEERRALFGEDHPTVAYSLSTLANLAVKQDNYDEGIKLSVQALDILERDGRSASREAALTRNGYAQALYMAGRDDEALREIDRTLVDWQRVAPNAKARRVGMLVQKAQILEEMKRTDDMRRTANEAIAVGADPSDLADNTKAILRDLSGRSDVYLDNAPPPAK